MKKQEHFTGKNPGQKQANDFLRSAQALSPQPSATRSFWSIIPGRPGILPPAETPQSTVDLTTGQLGGPGPRPQDWPADLGGVKIVPNKLSPSDLLLESLNSESIKGGLVFYKSCRNWGSRGSLTEDGKGEELQLRARLLLLWLHSKPAATGVKFWNVLTVTLRTLPKQPRGHLKFLSSLSSPESPQPALLTKEKPTTAMWKNPANTSTTLTLKIFKCWCFVS